MQERVRAHRLGWFFGLTFALSWSYWVPVALAGGSWSHVPGLLGPFAAAVVVTGLADGRAGLAGLARRAARWRVAPRWYLAAVVLVAASAAGVAVEAALDGAPSLRALGTMPGLPAIGWLGTFGLVLVLNGYGEEVGWRGVAWPELRDRYGPSRAATVLAAPWALWHLPTFWIDSGLRGFPLPLLPGWLIGLAAGAFVLGWLHDRTGGSLFVVALWHAVLNMASATEGTEGWPAALVTATVIALAFGIGRHEEHASAGTASDRYGAPPCPDPSPTTS
ncbi:MAG TPA: CPBP family intramembrane glutamic endopeptidase [Acidimicrobiales bacterium]|nr:CPBP family intramembrane glutamic endopeptidase [Acidimicrobiales bacterium]